MYTRVFACMYVTTICGKLTYESCSENGQAYVIYCVEFGIFFACAVDECYWERHQPYLEYVCVYVCMHVCMLRKV